MLNKASAFIASKSWQRRRCQPLWATADATSKGIAENRQ